MDTEDLIRPEDVATTIRSSDVLPHVNALRFQSDRQIEGRVYQDVLLYLPDKDNNGFDNYYRSPQVIDVQFMNVSGAIAACKPYLASINVDALTDVEKQLYDNVFKMAHGEDIDYQSIDLSQLPEDLKRLMDKVPTLPHDSLPHRAIDNIYQRSKYMRAFEGGPEIYDEMASRFIKIRSQESGSAALTQLSYEQRVTMHEYTHVADAQRHSGRLIDCLRTYDTLSKERKVHNRLPETMDNLRRINSLMHDVLEARAYVAECTGIMTRSGDNSAELYSHTALTSRMMGLLRSMLLVDARTFESAFIRNDPRAARGTGVIHEEHDGGALLVAFSENIDVDAILEDASYESLILTGSLEDEDQYRKTILQRIRDIFENPEETRRKLETSWDTYGILLDQLAERFEKEAALLTDHEGSADQH